MTNGCIRTTVTLLVFGAYLVWTWPWHREHGFEDIPWIGGRGRPRDRSSSGMGMGTEMETGTMGMGVEGILRAPELGVPEEIQARWGQYAPYRAMGRYVGPPEGCRVTQVSSRSCLVLARLECCRAVEVLQPAAFSTGCAAYRASGWCRHACGVGCAPRERFVTLKRDRVKVFCVRSQHTLHLVCHVLTCLICPVACSGQHSRSTPSASFPRQTLTPRDVTISSSATARDTPTSRKASSTPPQSNASDPQRSSRTNAFTS